MEKKGEQCIMRKKCFVTNPNDTIENKIVSNGQEIIIRMSVSKSAIFLKYKEFLTGEEGKCGGYELGSMLSTFALVNMDGKILEVPVDWIEFEDD